MEHVGVREDEVRAPADRGALVARRVAVVDRGTHALAQPELGDRARLVLRQRLRRVQVDRARLGVAAEHVERRQVEAQRLARRGAGRDDRRAVPRALQRLGLVRVQLLDAGGGERVAQRRGAVRRASRRATARARPRTPGARGARRPGRPAAARPTAPCERLRGHRRHRRLPAVRCLYADLDGTLLGRGASLMHDGDGVPTMLGVRAVEACLRADVEIVLMSGRRRAQVSEPARLLGQRVLRVRDRLGARARRRADVARRRACSRTRTGRRSTTRSPRPAPPRCCSSASPACSRSTTRGTPAAR